MGNIFDQLADSTFDVVTATMGYDALWNGNQARVLFNEPSRDETVSEHEYSFARPTMEYKSKDFIGLKSSADAKRTETVVIEGRSFYVRSIAGLKQSAKDGQTYTAFLEEIR